MVVKLLLRPRRFPAVACALAAGTTLFPRGILHAEAPPEVNISRKPIYDDLSPGQEPAKHTATNPNHSGTSPRQSPTDRLATQIRHARLFLHAHTAAAESRVNDFMTSVLHLENSFTSTIASLAPPPQSGEQVLPGGIYVLVAAMAGSIISRNRNIILRASVPVAVGIGAGWAVLPSTMRNVGDLLWTYEEKVPVVAENHMRIRGATEEGWRQIRSRAVKVGKWSEERVRDGREAVEDWVRKGG